MFPLIIFLLNMLEGSLTLTKKVLTNHQFAQKAKKPKTANLIDLKLKL
jgi:hypothetical protein